ncbi:LapA family protein [Stieleria varia]|uniref:Lipopolysaccharide assembly protein A domain-containing protein n=1 Tax=Stieleria varia TaxID=2528005 RepID=A0A5C6AYI6_9BACT|nr:LapA family protein [Stieleria varia]TWU04481.1 hypothetical protein Pla52n_25220 [Stieleria varia]
MMQRIRWFLLLFGVVVLLVFSLANTESVPVEMPFLFSTELPLAMLMVVTSGIGFVLGSLTTAWMLRRGRKPGKVTKPEPEPTAVVPPEATPEPNDVYKST